MFLKGVHVIDWSENLTGPFAARVLGDLGAEVLKVEQLGQGDPLRSVALLNSSPATGLANAVFGYVNQGKGCVGLDLDCEKDFQDFHRLLSETDILIESQPTERLKALGLTIDQLRSRYPKLVVVSVSNFGLVGPASSRIATDFTLQHDSGLAYHQARPVEHPLNQPPIATADREGPLAAGLAAANSAIWALLVAKKGEPAPHVDFSKQDFYAHLLFEALAEWTQGERLFDRERKDFKGTEVAGGLIWILPCNDGWVMTSPREQHQWDRWMVLLGSPDWAQDEALCGNASARRRTWNHLQDLMSEWTRDKARQTVFALAQSASVPCFPVNRAGDIFENAQLIHRRFFDTLKLPSGQKILMPGLPILVTTSSGSVLKRERCFGVPEIGDTLPFWASPRQPVPLIQTQLSQSTDCSKLPLQGLRVVDFSWVVAGPMATKMLAAMGAEVIKIESMQRPEFKKRKGYFQLLNGGKRSCTVNIAHPDGQALLHRLVQKSDVVVENFSSQVLGKYKLSEADFRTLKPDLIYCSASGVGRTGPQKDVLAYGTLLQGYSGRSALIGEINASLEGMGIVPAWTDPVTTMWEVVAILAALHHRNRTGEGAYLDVSMLEATVSLLPESLARFSLTGENVGPTSTREGGCSPCGVFRGANGESSEMADAWLSISVSTDKQWQALCAVMDRADLALDPLHTSSAGRLTCIDKLNAVVADWISLTGTHIAATRLQLAGIPASASRNLMELLSDEHLLMRGVFPLTPQGSRGIALPWKDENGWRGQAGSVPQLGEHNDYVFGELLGLDRSQIEELIGSGAIG
jgi:benzylsuccinate CoA-transferase BbsF subunit